MIGENPVHVGNVQGCPAFSFWTPHKAHHLAYAASVGERIVVAVRVFDIFAAIVVVTNDAGQYALRPADQPNLRFLAMDAVSGKMQETKFMDEQKRLAEAMIAARRPPPFPDPLPQ